VPKRPCTNRATWRVVRGQPQKRLSDHYKLECDYGTSLTGVYKEGDAVFLCEAHAHALNQSDVGSIAGVRAISTQSPDAKISHTTFKQGESPFPASLEAASPFHDESKITDESRTADVRAQPDIPANLPVVKPRTDVKISVARSLSRDVAFGDSAKALVDEAIWNLEPGNVAAYLTAIQDGKSALEAAQVAGGQLAIVHRRIREYTVKIDAILAESKATLSASEVIDRPLEKAMLEIIESGTLDEAEKDAAINQLGEFQEWISGKHGRAFSPLEAHQLARLIGDRANWGIGSCSVRELKPAYSVVYKSLRSAVLSAVPASREMQDRLANLCAAKCTLETELSQKLYSVAK